MPTITPIIAFGFANLVVLGWLAAAAAPILIHLWMRQTRRETAWAAIRFLQAAIERQARRLRVQHLILLAVRTLLIVCIVLAAAKPFLNEPGVFANLAGGVHRVLILDASLSMQATAKGESRFARAKRSAREIVTASAGADRYTVIAMADQPTVAISNSASKQATIRAIDTLSATAGEASPARALTQAERLLGIEADDPMPVGQSSVTLLTDLDEATWSEACGDESAAKRSLDRLKSVGELTAIDVTEPAPVGNASIARLRVDKKLITTNEPVTVTADIAWRRGGTPHSTEAQLLVGDRVVATQPVTVQPGAENSVAFTHRFSEEGDLSVEVRLGEDSLVADNRRFRVVKTSRRTRVLCVAGTRGADRYVASALNPTGDRDASIAVDRVTDADLASTDLGPYVCVFCCNVPAFTEGEAIRLAEFVSGGGGLVLFLGDRVDAGAYNRRLATPTATDASLGAVTPKGVFRFASLAETDAASPALLPFVFGDSYSSDTLQIDPLDYAHPIIAPFRGRERAGLITAPIMRYTSLQLSADDSRVQVALATASGDPLLVAAPFQDGRVAVVATAASLESVNPATGGPWTAWPAWPSFLPVVRGLLEYTAGAASDAPTQSVGQQLSGRPLLGSPPTIERPDGVEEEVLLAADSTWLYTNTNLAGVYRLQAAGGPGRAFAVNTSTAESSLARIDRDRLPESLTVIDAGSAVASDSPGQQQTPLHRLLIYAAIVLALADTVLASWFGRGSR